jgi:hypothetical protein
MNILQQRVGLKGGGCWASPFRRHGQWPERLGIHG